MRYSNTRLFSVVISVSSSISNCTISLIPWPNRQTCRWVSIHMIHISHRLMPFPSAKSLYLFLTLQPNLRQLIKDILSMVLHLLGNYCFDLMVDVAFDPTFEFSCVLGICFGSIWCFALSGTFGDLLAHFLIVLNNYLIIVIFYSKINIIIL